MANQIILKRSSTPGKVPTTSQLALGEIGINTFDGLIYIKKDDGTPTVVQIGGITSVNTKTGAVVLSTTDISEGTAQYFTNARARQALNGSTGITYSSTTGAIAVDTATIATRTYVDSAVSDLVASAPSTLNTLNELAAALNSDASFSTTVATSIATKLAKSANLSDVDNVSTARTNLGLSTVAASGSYADLSNKPTTADYRGALSAGTGLSYNSTTGVFTNTITQYTDAMAKAAVSFSAGSGGYNSTTGVFSIPTNTSQLTNGAGFATTSYVDSAVQGKDNSDEITEGTTNLFFTNARARSAVSFSAGSGAYNSTTGVISIPTNTSQLTNGASFITLGSLSASTGMSYNSSTGAISTTITQYTDALARGAVSAGTGISYNSTTGVITNTITQYTDALARASVSFVAGSGAYNSTTGVMTIPTNTSQLTNGANFATTSYVDSAVAGKDNTDELTEGTTNLFFTTARARGAVSASGSLSYNSTTGVISYTTPSTTGVSEGTNLYYTDARARAAVSAGTGISYSSSTGVITNTITQYTDALARGAVSASTGLSYNSTTGVFTNTITQYTDALARAAHSAGTGISYNSTTGAISADTTVMSTRAYVDTSISNLVGGASAAYDTLVEIQNAMATDAELSAAIAALTIGNGTQTVTAGSYLTGGGSFTANQTSSTSVSLAVDATSANTASKVVARDASGNFSAGTITATLTGNTTGTHTGAVVGNASTATTAGTITSQANSATITAASANTASTIVLRDASGNFSAGTITATLTGNTTGTHTGAVVGNASTATTAGTVTTAAQTAITSVGTLTGLTVSGATATGALTVTGGITASGEITAYFSDERLKQDIAPIQDALSKVMAIGGYTYKANDLAHELGVSRYDNQIGLLAGEVEAVMPELVTQSALEGYKTIRYDKVVSVLVEAIKEQQAMIEELRKDVKKTLR